MQAHSLYRYPKAMRWQCDTVCADCVYRNDLETVSLDAQVTSELSDDENSLLDIVIDNFELMEDLMCDADELNHLLHRLKELMLEATQIGELRDENLSDTEIAERIGVKRTTFLYRLNRVREILKNELPEFFYQSSDGIPVNLSDYFLSSQTFFEKI